MRTNSYKRHQPKPSRVKSFFLQNSKNRAQRLLGLVVMKILKFVFVSILITQSWSVNASWFGPDNYEDCILENIPTAKTDRAVELVIQTCRQKFPSEFKPRTPSSEDFRTGTFACEETIAPKKLTTVTIDEAGKTITVGRHQHKILNKTEKKIYATVVDGDMTMDFIFETPSRTFVDDLNYLFINWRFATSGKSGYDKYWCEKSI